MESPYFSVPIFGINYLVLKCVHFETTKKELINSPVKYEHPLMERPNISVWFLAPPP